MERRGRSMMELLSLPCESLFTVEEDDACLVCVTDTRAAFLFNTAARK
jgi:hypothetical protein